MPKSKAALAVLWCAMAFAPSASAAKQPQTLTLDQAFARTLESHPGLKQLPLQRDRLSAEAELAAQSPALSVGLSAENVLGSGAFNGVDSAEFSLTLSSVLERGEKREARIAVADSRLAGTGSEAEAQRLDLLAEVARRYLDALAAQENIEAAALLVEQRRRTVAAATRRVDAGASPVSVRLSAEAALARAELDHARHREVARASRRRLALLWGERDPDFDSLRGDLFDVPAVPGFEELAVLLERSPELRRFATESRLREARLQLARSETRADLEWQVGLRRLQAEGDWALLGGVSMPLGNRRRAEPGIRAAEAELASLDLEREAGALNLYATLAEAHGRLRADALAVERGGDDVLPRLERAESSAGAAYRAGALSYLEWAQLQSDLLDARRERIAAARDAHRALIEIQRLTAEPFALAASALKESTP